MVSNKAAWITKPHGKLEVGDGPEPQVGDHDVLIENKAVAINPSDQKVQEYNVIIEIYPWILGTDLAGVVADVGCRVSKVKKGDRVLGYAPSLATGAVLQSAFQAYTVIPEIAVSPIPDSLSFDEAAVIPLGLATAAAGLYPKDFLHLPYPQPGSPKPTSTALLVWGAGSSVGASAVQLAVASGVEVIATSSKKNFDMVKSLGAAYVIDYNSPSAVEEIIQAFEGKRFAGAYDAISVANTYKAVNAVVEKLGGGFIAGTLDIPEGVRLGQGVVSKPVLSPLIFFQEPEVGGAIYKDFLPAALKSDKYKAKPDPQVMGHGLESIQGALDAYKQGVSATKLVVTV